MIYYIEAADLTFLCNWLTSVFGIEDTWRFLSYSRKVITSSRYWYKVSYVQIDRPGDCLYFELVFGDKYRKIK